MAKGWWIGAPKEDHPAWLAGFVFVAVAVLVVAYIFAPALLLGGMLAIGSARAVSPEQIHGGILTWYGPAWMRVGGRETIEVYLSDRQAILDLIPAARSSDPPIVADVEMGPRMRVQLRAAGASIDELRSRDQYMIPGRPGHWTFEITPSRGGLLTLRLLLSVRLIVDGREEVVELSDHERIVEVKVSPFVVIGRAALAHRKWAVTALFIPLALWFLQSAGLTDRAALTVRSWFGPAPAVAPPGPAERN